MYLIKSPDLWLQPTDLQLMKWPFDKTGRPSMCENYLLNIKVVSAFIFLAKIYLKVGN